MAKRNKCTGCKQYFDKESLIVVTAGKFHNRGCLINYAYHNTDKVLKSAKNREASDDALRKKIFKGNDITLQHKLTQKAFNKMRVLQELKWFEVRNIKPYCISCGKEKMDWCCGHYKTVGSHSELRYSTFNTFLQCNRYCNMALSGNLSGTKTTIGYTNGIIERFGDCGFNKLMRKISVSSVKKWTGIELQELRKSFNSEIRRLERH